MVAIVNLSYIRKGDSKSSHVWDLENPILPNIIKLFLFYSQNEWRMIMITHVITCHELFQDNPIILSSPLISWARFMIEPIEINMWRHFLNCKVLYHVMIILMNNSHFSSFTSLLCQSSILSLFKRYGFTKLLAWS